MNVLLVMPNYFDYPQIISNGLKDLGYEVDYINDRPSSNSFIKAIIRVKKEVIGIYVNKYFKRVMSNVRTKKYNYVILILGQSLSFSESMISEIRKSQKNAKFIIYQWDSINNLEKSTSYYKYFDKHYTFDRLDSKENNQLEFLPLFYSPKYENIGKKTINKFKYDFSFVGTAHPKKYKFIKKMSDQLKKVYPDQFIYYFLPSRIVYLYRKLKNPEFKDATYSEFHFKPLSGENMNEVITNSKCILDTAQSGQVGLPIRVIEALGANKKLITTNPDIVNYDFYRKENIYVYNGKNFNLNDVFFKSDYVNVDQRIYESYSLRNWLKKILGVN